MFDNLKVLYTKEGQIDLTVHPYVFLGVLLGSKDTVEVGDEIQKYVFYMPVHIWYEVLNQKIEKSSVPYISWTGRKKKEVEEKYIKKYFHWSSREYRKNKQCLSKEEVKQILEKYDLDDKERKDFGLSPKEEIKIEKPKQEGMLTRWSNGV